MRLLFGLSLLFQYVAICPTAGANWRGWRSSAQEPEDLAADADLMDTMRDFNAALGVQCDYCHTPGDFSSDANPRKETSRKMIAMVRRSKLIL